MPILLPCPFTIGLAVLSEVIGPKGRKEEVGGVIVLRNGGEGENRLCEKTFASS